jgi:PAS domain S-box-containing protein
VAASRGVAGSAVATYTLSLDDWNNPLIAALNNRRQAFFSSAHSAADRKRRPSTPFEDAAFHVIPLGIAAFAGDASGLLLIGSTGPLPPDVQWFTTIFGQKLDQIVRNQSLAEAGRRQGRERALLHSIINAVTDPILLTDTEGRLLIANARALTLFTASEEESEGRRSAVRMNNMLLSSALSSKAIEEIGARRRELLLVNPVDGSDLLFELLSTVTEDPRQGTGVVSILRNVTDLRRASEEIEENYRKLRSAEVQARAHCRHRRERCDVVNERAGRAALHCVPQSKLYRAALGAGQRRTLLILHCRHARQRGSAPGR